MEPPGTLSDLNPTETVHDRLKAVVEGPQEVGVEPV
jgi:hypothetical protein